MQNLARRLRQKQTDAEMGLWYHLRAKRLLGFKFRRQVALGRYIVDFVCHDAKLIIELDGGQHVDRVSADNERTAWLAEQGFRVVRFWNHEVFKNREAVLERIAALLLFSPSP